MRDIRSLLIAILAVVCYGSLAITGGYAWYLRSGFYREGCAARLTQEIGLAAAIGEVVPRSQSAREFRDVRVWLPEKRGLAAVFERAIVRYVEDTDDPEAYELELRGGQTELSARTWLREDYRTVLESGLRPGFSAEGPKRIQFSEIDLTCDYGRFQLELSGASGVIEFPDRQRGVAHISCENLNGRTASRPVTVMAEFSPREAGVCLDRVLLTVPAMPIGVVGLEQLAGVHLEEGAFEGRVQYSEAGVDSKTVVTGKLFNVSLAECTAPFVPLPWHGRVPELELEHLELVDGEVQRVRFRGVVMDMVLGDLLAPWKMKEVGGELTLFVNAAEFSEAGVEELIISANCDSLSLEPVWDWLGWGKMSGQAKVEVSDLTIVENRLASLGARIEVAPRAGEVGVIERALLSAVLEHTLGFGLPEFLPERFEYTQLGVELDARDELLYVFGTHGPREKTILSVSLAGQELGVVFEPEQPFDLRPHLDRLRAELRRRLAEWHAGKAWRGLWSLPTTLPSSGE